LATDEPSTNGGGANGHHYTNGGGPLDFIWYLKEDVNEFLSHW